LLLTAKAQDVFAVLPTSFGESLIYQVLPALFSELYRLGHGTIKNFVIVIPLEIVYPRPAVETLRKLA
jgi:superfamily II DNA helicase RecQ